MISQRIFLLFVVALSSALAQNKTIKIDLDLTDAPRRILRAHMTIPVQPGPITLNYAQWIPGEHAPSGPIDNFAGIVFSANGKVIPWQRDDVNMFAFRLNVPAGVTEIEATTDFLATAAPSGFSAGASTSPNLAVVAWNEVVLYPAGVPSAEIKFSPSIKLPAGWQFGTSLLKPAAARTQRNLKMFHLRRWSILLCWPESFLKKLRLRRT